jgi:flagellar basal-body rod protein FlgB
MSGLFSDNAITASAMALSGLTARQQAISNNLANIDTPGYRAQTVDFESTVKRALNSSGSLKLAATNPSHLDSSSSKAMFTTTARPGGTARADENNVDIDTELLQMSETGIQYQAVSQSISKKLELLKTIASR